MSLNSSQYHWDNFTVGSSKLPAGYFEEDLEKLDHIPSDCHEGKRCKMIVNGESIDVSIETIKGNIITVLCSEGFFHTCEILGRHQGMILLKPLTSVNSMKQKHFPFKK